MTEHDGAASFIAKWRARHPELALLDAFCVPAQRPLLACWAALQLEWREALLDTADAGVAATKLAWWGEDLAGGSRHPLARALLAEPRAQAVPGGDWRRLCDAAIALAETARADAGPSLPAVPLAAFCDRLAPIEAQLFAAPSAPAAIAAGLDLQWLRRCSTGDDAPIAATLLQRVPAARMNLYRAGQWAFDRWALDRIAAGAAPAALGRPPAWRALLLAWTAARRSRQAG